MSRDCDIYRMEIDAYDPQNIEKALQNSTIKVHKWHGNYNIFLMEYE